MKEFRHPISYLIPNNEITIKANDGYYVLLKDYVYSYDYVYGIVCKSEHNTRRNSFIRENFHKGHIYVLNYDIPCHYISDEITYFIHDYVIPYSVHKDEFKVKYKLRRQGNPKCRCNWRGVDNTIIDYVLYEDEIFLNEPYYFINTNGLTCVDFLGINNGRDTWRKLSGNFFKTKEDADNYVFSIVKKATNNDDITKCDRFDLMDNVHKYTMKQGNGIIANITNSKD